MARVRGYPLGGYPEWEEGRRSGPFFCLFAANRMHSRRICFWALLLLPACGGGGGGGDDGPGDPGPVDPFAFTTNTGLAVRSFKNVTAVGSNVLVGVVASVDTTTGDITNLGYAIVGPMLSTGKTCAFLAGEAANGNTDYNGDGDSADAVWFVFDPARPVDANNPLNTGVATSALGQAAAATEGGYVFMRSEAAEGMDMSGDGDLLDSIATAYQEAVSSVVPLPPATYAPGTAILARNGRVLFAVSEASAAADLNRDGDAFDRVLVVVTVEGPTAFLQPVGNFFPRAVGPHPYALTNDAVVYLIDEAAEGGRDLNGDGDSLDAIVAVFDIANMTGEHLPVDPGQPVVALAADPLRGIGASGTRAVVALSEPDNNSTDLNGDLDNFDAVVAWIDTETAPTRIHIHPFALAQLPLLVSGERALVAIGEKSNGAIVGNDLNGDGDIDDAVAFMLDMPGSQGAMFNLSLAVRTVALNGNDALVGVPENGHFNGDLNGNGVVGDTLTFYFDFSDTPPTMRSLGIVANATSVFRLTPIEVRLAALVPEGQSNTLDDINGDGDEKDRAVLLLGIDPSGSAPFLLPQTPFFAGTGAFFASAPLRVGDDVFAFATAEDMLKKDLNGDGDTLDTILHFVKYK